MQGYGNFAKFEVLALVQTMVYIRKDSIVLWYKLHNRFHIVNISTRRSDLLQGENDQGSWPNISKVPPCGKDGVRELLLPEPLRGPHLVVYVALPWANVLQYNLW